MKSFFNISSENPISLSVDQSVPENLYHYTGTDGLMGIIQNKCFWVSKSEYLNDSSELIYIKNIIIKACESLTENREIYFIECEKEGCFFDSFISQIKQICSNFEDFISRQPNDIYILSLSGNKDSLTLFSNYTSHYGYNLGLSPQKLFEELKAYKFVSNNSKEVFVTRGKVNYA